ncbi:hypothetical protein G4V62_03450 [Bacillaceae bacterium SIJ1]|uniref:methionine gamma-lyase family protein n=1 Tax=Litoribacterium kuwaitense TaxID=1398745 RepID=UPI0013EA2714|nr:methionine gamma-lyase family protein [Litoribacterium kuwaitense]NGP44050.1 hypothetical protein [Litoribacterium kuwaitense]
MNTQSIDAVSLKVEGIVQPAWEHIQHISEHNQVRVLKAFQAHRVTDTHFNDSTGYGYDDSGRDVLEAIYADVFGTEDALVRPQLISGTHAIVTALSGLLRPGDELLYATGQPYDTLHDFLGLTESAVGSMNEYQISYRDVALTAEGHPNVQGIVEAIRPETKVVALQRSCGYEKRPALSINDIERLTKEIKKTRHDMIVFVDNCYGEFTEMKEPGHVNVDIMAGSLIKNPGGGLARTGGYIAGTEKLVQKCAARLTAPGLQKEIGPSLGQWPLMYQGLFLAPHTVGQALKGAVFTAGLFSELDLKTWPSWRDERSDLIQTVEFPDASSMISFCQSIQASSPVNSQFLPIPSAMPGYDSEVIMAAGTFVQGASLEFSADGPVKPPYRVFVQGGLTYEHVKWAIKEAAKAALQRDEM